MFCKYCGNVMNDNDVFCSNCGKSVGEKQNPVQGKQNPQTNAEPKKNIVLINVILGAIAVVLAVVNILLVVSIKTIEQDTNNSYVFEMAMNGIDE